MSRLLTIAATLCFFATPTTVDAQTAKKMYRIGFLEVVPLASNTLNVRSFTQGLGAIGYVEGRHFIIEYRSADGRGERFVDLARELARLNVDVIVTRGTPAALAAKRATGRIPIVMASSGDPVASGIITSLAHPGGNVTGLSALAVDVQGELLEVLREVVPNVVNVACLFNMGNPVLQAQWKEVQPAARSMGLRMQLLDVRLASDLEPALDSAVKQRAEL